MTSNILVCKCRSIIAILLIGILVAVRTLSAAPTPPPLLNRSEVVAAAQQVRPADYPNADDVVVDERIHTVYEADGTYQTWDDEYIKILTEKGKRSHETVSRHYTLPYGTVEITDLSIIKPDGQTVTIDVAANSRVMVDPGQMSANIYNPNSKILQVGVPGLEIGDLLHIRSFDDTVKPRIPGTWSDYTVLEYTAPIIHIQRDVYGPAALPLSNIRLYDAVSNTVTFTESVAADSHHYRWEVRNVPRMFPEPNMPALHTVVQRLLVSTIPDWQTISRWYWELCQPHLNAVNPQMKAKVTELTDGVDDRMEKIERLFTFVSQQIRYMGITTETTAPGYEPHDVCLTFDNRYGVCRDKAALLVAMLRLADLPAYPVIIHAGPRKDEEVPQPFFNHAVVAVGNDDGSYILMDPTDENTTAIFPPYLSHMSYLVAHPEGEDLRTSPVVPAADNLLAIETTGTLGRDGHLSLSSDLRFNGINDNAYRRHFTRLKPDERRQFFERQLKQRIAGATLTDLRIRPLDMQDTSQPLAVTLTYEAPDVPIRGDRHAMLAIPWLSDTLGYANFLLGRTGLAERKYPLYTGLTAGVRETFRVTLDAEIAQQQEVLPAPCSLSSEGISYDQSFHSAHTALQATASFMIDAVEFSPAAYLGLKQLLKDREYAQRQRVMFQEADATARDHDVRILSDDLDITISDATHWTVRHTLSKKILTYAGKKDHAELTFPFNPAWETVTLAFARVENPDGTTHTVVDDEMNMMDAAWVGSAPRYPPQRTLVVSLPGVEEGSIITYEVVHTHSGKPFFSLRKTFQREDPVEASSVHVTRPTDLPLQVTDLTGSPDYTVQTDAGTTTHTWHIGPQPAVKPESNLPPSWTWKPTLLLSAGNWPDYAAQWKRALTTATTDQPVCAQHARALTADCTNTLERVQVIRDAVARSIRSAGPSLSALPWSAVTAADTTWADGYGNTTDRAIVLATMLKAVGLEPEFILTSQWAPRLPSLSRVLQDTPQHDLFTHLLVRIMHGRDALYLNETDQYATLGTTPFEGQPGLDMQGALLTVDPPAAMQTRSRATFHLTLDADGDARLTATRAYYGMTCGALRRRYAEMPPEDRRRHFMELVSSLSQSATADGPLETDFDGYPGFRGFTVDIPRFGVREGSYLYVTLPPGIAHLLQLTSDTREEAFYRSDPHHEVVRYEVDLPANTRQIHLVPPEWEWTGPDGLGTVQCTYAPGTDPTHLTLTQQADLRPAVVRPEAYPVLLPLQRHLQHPAARTILIELEE